MSDPFWREKAVCPTVFPELFFPEQGTSTLPAKRVCLTCPALLDCLSYALENEELTGVWGAMSDQERRRVRKGESSAKILARTRARTEAPPGPPRSLQVCVVCGAGFEGHRLSRYCSDACRPAKGRPRAVPERKDCVVCGDPFMGDKRERYCSQRCSREGIRLWKRAYDARKREGAA